MKFLFIFAIFLCPLGFAENSAKPPLAATKTYRSDYGYEFKYPDCWVVRGDGPHEPAIPGPEAHSIFVEEGDQCKRPLMYDSVPNGIGISGGRDKLGSKAEADKRAGIAVDSSKNAIARNEWTAFKHLEIPAGGQANIIAERVHKVKYEYIKWEMDLYCSKYLIRFTGPFMKNPDKALYDKFKAGDLALPEPEKTIYESIRCVEPVESKKKN